MISISNLWIPQGNQKNPRNSDAKSMNSWRNSMIPVTQIYEFLKEFTLIQWIPMRNQWIYVLLLIYLRASPPAAAPPTIDDWLIVDWLLDWRLLCCIFMMFMFFCRGNAFWADFWSLWADLGAYGLTFEGLGLTLEAHGVTLGAFELQFSSPWGHLGVILAAIGLILGSLGCSKSFKMHQEC